MKNRLLIAVWLFLLAGCGAREQPITGILEWDLVRLPAPVSERITAIPVHEGETVTAGTVLLRFDDAMLSAQLQAGEAELQRLKAAAEELRAGARREQREIAQAQVTRTEKVAANARREYERIDKLVSRKLLPPSELDRARAEAGAAEADVAAARAALAELQNGTRPEQLAQAEAAVASATARVEQLRIALGKLTVTAPRDGKIDSLPFKLGDQPPSGAVAATLLVGTAPYARVYIPEPLRAQIAPGKAMDITADGVKEIFRGRVRSIAREATFTPYYALAGRDVSRLSYLAQIELGPEASSLPAGLPVKAVIAGVKPDE